MNEKKNLGLYDKSFEHDNCGIGAVVNIKGVKTHITVSNALKIVEQLEHRAGKDAAGETGDGVGILTQVPYSYFKKTIKEFPLPLEGKFGVGMLFMPRDEHLRNRVKKMLETIVIKEGMEFLGWREVPTVPKVLGQKALDAMPSIWQCFIKNLMESIKGSSLIESFIKLVEFLNKAILTIPMYVLFHHEQLFIKECSWLDNCAHFLKIFKMMNIRVRLR